MGNAKDTVFITGANGFIGRNICRTFSKMGFKVIAGVRNKADHFLPAGVDQVICDLQNPTGLGKKLLSVNYIIHCAGNAKFQNGQEFFLDNVECTINLINEVKSGAKNFKRFIFISSIAAMDRGKSDGCDKPLSEVGDLFPSTDYGKSKAQAEEILTKSGLEYCILRPAQIVGPGMRIDSHFAVFAQWALKKKLFSLINWPGMFSIIHVEDLAQAILTCTKSNLAKNELFLCGGHNISLGNFFKTVGLTPNLAINWIIPIAKFMKNFLPFSVKSNKFLYFVSINFW